MQLVYYPIPAMIGCFGGIIPLSYQNFFAPVQLLGHRTVCIFLLDEKNTFNFKIAYAKLYAFYSFASLHVKSASGCACGVSLKP